MWMSLRRVPAFVLTSMLLSGMAYAGGGEDQGPSTRGPIFDITHFDVLPVNTDTPKIFEQAAYTALFKYRDLSLSDPGSKSFRVVNWLLAPNHSQIIDVWSSLDAFEHIWRKLIAPTSGLPCSFSPPGPSALQLLYRQPDRRPPIQPGEIIQHAVDQRQPRSGISRRARKAWAFCRDICRFPGGRRPGQGPSRTGTLPRRHQQGVRPTQLYRPAADRPAEPLRHPGGLELVYHYNNWQTNTTTTNFDAKVRPLLEFPFDHRLNRLCGETYVDNTGCTSR